MRVSTGHPYEFRLDSPEQARVEKMFAEVLTIEGTHIWTTGHPGHSRIEFVDPKLDTFYSLKYSDMLR